MSRPTPDLSSCEQPPSEDLTRTRLLNRSRLNEGFTLVELLIVMVILGIIAGIAILGLTGFKENAQSACHDANTRIDKTVAAANAVNPSGAAKAFATGGSC